MFTLWNDKKLAAELHEGRVTQKTRFVYFLIFSLTNAFMISTIVNYHVYAGNIVTVYDYIIDMFTLVSIFITSFLFFHVNKSGDNIDFIDRYICLGLPAVIRASLLIMLPFFAFLIVLSGFYSENCAETFPQSWCEQYVDMETETVQTTSLDAALVMAVLLYFYWRMYTGFKIASGQKNV